MGESRLRSAEIESRRTVPEPSPRDEDRHQPPDKARNRAGSGGTVSRKSGAEKGAYPLSFAQQRLWFLDQLKPSSSLYNMPAALRLSGALDVPALQAALNQMVERHESLRARFASIDGGVVQIVSPPLPVELRVFDLSAQLGTPREADAEELVRQEINRPFDLSAHLLVRALLIRLESDEHIFVLTTHHIAFDEWSLKIFLRELATFYGEHTGGEPASLPELPMRYVDYAVWQRDPARQELFERQLSFWREQLGGDPPAPELPMDHPRQGAPTFRGSSQTRQATADLHAALKAMARKFESSLFMVLLAAFKALVHRYSRLDDIIVATPVAGRNRLEFENVIGMFVNTLLIRTKFPAGGTFEQLLKGVRVAALSALSNQDVPFDKIVEELNPARSLLHLPFTRLMFVFQNEAEEPVPFPRLQTEWLEAETETAKFDVTFIVQETRRGLRLRVEYNAELFEAETMKRLLAHFENLLRSIVCNPSQKLGELKLLSEAEEARQLLQWNETSTNYPRDKCVHQLFEAQVERAPEALAVDYEGQILSYRELNERANQLAASLKPFGVGPDVPVAVLMERSPQMIIAWLAILKAGGAYVPIHTNYPKERLEFMLADTRAPVLLTQQGLLPSLSGQLPEVICLDTGWERIASQSQHNPDNASSPENLAYVIYTSGSTGQPKGVAIPHRAINRLVLDTNYIRFTATDRVAQISNASFDAATFEVWGALLNGGRLVGFSSEIVCSPLEFARELKAKGISGMFVTAALFNQIAREAPGAFETVRTVIAGGEALDPKWVRAVLLHRPPARLLNGYGPTENTTFSCCHEIAELPETASSVPIGHPISNTQAYVLDQNLQPSPIGVAGELYLGGDGLARGYWNRPDLTAQCFISNPHGEFRAGNGVSQRLYRTGDRARYLADGSIEFLGRVDHQVKIRGFRVELGEIETILRQHEAIGDCVVAVHGQSAEDKRLVAYLVPAEKRAPTATELRAWLECKLPGYMVPSTFVPLDKLPLTANGKVDRDALPKPDHNRPELEKSYLAPQDEVERKLAAIWEDLLEVRPIGIEDKFFDLGGHSLLAVRVIAEIEKAFNKKLRLATIFLAPSIQQLAAVLREEVPEEAIAASSSVVELQPKGTRPPLFLVHGAGGGMIWGYMNLARNLGTDQPLYAFKSRGLDGREELDSIEEMAAQYVIDLQKIQPRGPYNLGGYCFGGIVAQEMARQLEARGERLELLALFNCSPPNSRYTKARWTTTWFGLLLRNLSCLARYSSEWSPSQWRGFLRWKWARLQRRFAGHRGASSAELFRAEAENFVDLSSFSTEQRKIWAAHISALVRFHPQPISSPILLFRSPAHPLWCSFDEDYGWGDYTSGGITRMIVPAAHEKILEEPAVKDLSAKLKESLAQGNRGPLSCQELASRTGHANPNAPSLDGAPPSGSEESEPARHERSAEACKVAPASTNGATENLAFWKEQLKGTPALLELPTDFPRPAVQSCRAGVERSEILPDLARQMRSVAQRHEVDLRALLVGAVSVLLRRYGGHHDIVVAVPTSLQKTSAPSAISPLPKHDDAHEPIFGTDGLIVLRTKMEDDPPFCELLERVKKSYSAGLLHADLPFTELVSALNPPRDRSYHPVVQILCAAKDRREAQVLVEPARANSRGSKEDRGVPCLGTADRVPLAQSPSTEFDLSFQLAESSNGLTLEITYAVDLFESATIRRMLGQIQTLFASTSAAPERRISRLALLTAEEERTLVTEWTATEQPFPESKTLAQLFEEQAKRTPEAEALVCGATRLNYRELLSWANQAASRLRTLGVREEALVGICLNRSAEMIAAILGTLQAGGAYVPLDPAYPKDRLAFMVADAKVRVLLTQRSLLASLPETEAKVLCVEDIGFGSQLPSSMAAEESYSSRPARSSDLAYVIYTSGSTGQPKGVALEHRGAVALVSWGKNIFTSEELSGVLAATSICFDLSVFEIFLPLSWGGKIILADNALALATLPAANEVRLINTVPSAIRELLRVKGVPPSVQVVNLAGEPLPTELVNQIYRQTSARKVYDLYGPTETTTYSTFTLRRPELPATIGKPLANEQVYLLDKNLQLVPVGVPGEIYIGGAGLARGYLNRPELTAERFVPHPFQSGCRLYKTGDLGRWRADGNLEFLGRIDHQVKIRGFRIELGEIESVLKRHPEVREAVVMAREDQPGNRRLVAYVTPAQHRQNATPVEDLRRCIREKLPEYMLPSAFVFLPSLPLTPNGKVDRKALPPPVQEDAAVDLEQAESLPPDQAKLAAIWREVLHLKRVDISDNFFNLGGDSLLAIQAVARIREAFDVQVPLTGIFETPTIASLAQGLASGQWKKDNRPAPALQHLPRTGPLPVSSVQERLWFLEQLEPGGHAYHVPAALRVKGSLDLASLERAINEIADRHEALRTTFAFNEAEGILTQVVSPKARIVLEVSSLTERQSVQQWLNLEAQKPFDLARGPLFRVNVLRLDTQEHVLLAVFHHTVADGWSLGIFFRELEVFYKGTRGSPAESGLPLVKAQPADHAHLQRRWMQDGHLEQELAFWRTELSGAPAAIDLPLDRPLAPAESDGKAGCESIEIYQELLEQMQKAGQEQGLTPFMYLMAALAILMHKWTGQHDLVTGTVVAGRSRCEIESVIGCFMNFLPIRSRFTGGETGDEILARTRTAILQAQSHQECPFEKIVEAINPERKLNQNPLYNVALLLQNFLAEPFRCPGLETQPATVFLEAALLDLRFEAEQRAHGLTLHCEYRSACFEKATIDQLLLSFLQVLDTIIRQPQTSLRDFKLSSGLETQALAARGRQETQTLAIAGTFTAEPVEEPLRYWMRELELPAVIEFAPYNQIFQQLLDPGSLLAKNQRGLNVLFVRLEDWLRERCHQSSCGAARQQFLSESPSASPIATSSEKPKGEKAPLETPSPQSDLERNVNEFVLALKAAILRPSAPYFVCLCPPSNRVTADSSLSVCLSKTEKSLAAELASMNGVYVMSSADMAELYPVSDYYDASADELGKVPYTPVFFTALATIAARRLHALCRSNCKVIVLDCDQTLWSGVCGEDGPQGIRLDPPRRALQEFMRAQHQAGRLLCACSKNNEEEIQEVFTQRTEMPLRREHFAAWRVNWLPKSENLKTLAKELQLGLDSFVFIDDNPVECAEVEANCPEVLTLQLPEDPELIPGFLAHSWVFDHLKLTTEDRKRAQMYRENRQREQLRSSSLSLADFLAGLDLRIRIDTATSEQLARVAQLTQRTNQFNFTTLRRTESEIAALRPRMDVLAVRVSDRFGDYGMTGLILFERKGEALDVDTFLLSCRVLGRGVEHRMLARLGEHAQQRRLKWVDIHFCKTARNKPALNFLERVGARFRQPLNGGFLYRFPAGFAAEVAFDPAANEPSLPEAAAAPSLSVSQTVGVATAPAPKFTRCRAIAIEASDAVQIHRAVEAKTVQRAGPRGGHVPPRTQLERQLCGLWQKLLHVESVGVRDNFFDLGGHSLLAVRLFAQVEKLTGRKFPLVTLFQAPTIEQLAGLLSHREAAASRSVLVPIQPNGAKPPLFLVHGAGGDVLWGYANLAALMPSDQPIYGIKSRGQLGLEECERVEEMASFYLQEVRSFQRQGPYFFGGYCFGGNVAYEMARQLRAQGEDVALVALMDSAPANAGYESLRWWNPAFPWHFARNLYFWLDDFTHWKPEERRRFVQRKTRAFGRKILRWFAGQSAVHPVDIEEVIDPVFFPENELKLWQIHLNALIEHVEQPYPGSVVLLRTRGEPIFCSFTEDFCWSRIAQGGVNLKRIPGSHENIFMEPNVQVLAQELTAALAAANTSEPSVSSSKTLLPVA